MHSIQLKYLVLGQLGRVFSQIRFYANTNPLPIACTVFAATSWIDDHPYISSSSFCIRPGPIRLCCRVAFNFKAGPASRLRPRQVIFYKPPPQPVNSRRIGYIFRESRFQRAHRRPHRWPQQQQQPFYNTRSPIRVRVPVVPGDSERFDFFGNRPVDFITSFRFEGDRCIVASEFAFAANKFLFHPSICISG